MKLIIFLLTSFFLCTQEIEAQETPRDVSLPIPNIMQETPVWCWAAVAQQIIQVTQGGARTPPQCALVAMANNTHPNVCCSGFGNPSCIRTGSIPQIQFLIAQFGGRYSSIAPPTDPLTLYNTLASGKPIILQVRTGIVSAHVVVLTGMTFTKDRFGNTQPILLINDPLAHFSQKVLYRDILPLWMSAIVVY